MKRPGLIGNPEMAAPLRLLVIAILNATLTNTNNGENEVGHLAISILNFFPYKDKSYFIVSTHKKFKCEWGNEILLRLKDTDKYDKTLSEILAYKILFWAMSPELYTQISEQTIEKYKNEVVENIDNYRTDFNSDFDLFDSVIHH